MVKFDYDVPGYEDNIYPISVASSTFTGNKHTMITREMIPLILAWSVNTHKLQGSTRTKIVVDLANHVFQKGLLYVALSRCTKLGGVAISYLNASKLLSTTVYTPCDQESLAEMERLRESARNRNH